MSEFSESYHLISESSQDAADLLKRAGLKGYVYEPVNGWVTFLAEEGSFESDERIVAAAKHPLLHYVCAEDHGCSIKLFHGAEVICAHSCDWNEDLTVDDSGYSRAALEEFLPTIHKDLLDNFERLSPPEGPDELFEEEPAKIFAKAVGLKHYEWLSYDYMESNFHDSPQDYPGVKEVS
jgi:hypothetical protein